MSQYPLQSSQQSSTQGLQDFIDSRNMLESPAYFFRFSYVLVYSSTKDSTLGKTAKAKTVYPICVRIQ